MRISDWPIQERPREKLLKQGAGQLSDAELLAVLLRSGRPGCSAVDTARAVLGQFGSLRSVCNAPRKALCAHPGVGDVTYAQLQSALELSRRCLQESLQRQGVFHQVSDTRRYLQSKLADEPRETFALLLLDSQHRLIEFLPVFFGTIDCATVHPRILVTEALKYNAAAVILAHNHPSGVAEPSEADRQITRRIVQAFALMDIRVLDHFVVGDVDVISFAERGWM